MNERINNLIEQSGFGSYAEIPDTYIVHKNDLVEFAELMVRECSLFVFKQNGPKSALNLLEHFGVEE